ncbi:hypothetical protein QJS66_02095 [Kocuria rhizophila]|nr:hypothetical protein QJS66_02095 [Kocuria rhizophila]
MVRVKLPRTSGTRAIPWSWPPLTTSRVGRLTFLDVTASSASRGAAERGGAHRHPPDGGRRRAGPGGVDRLLRVQRGPCRCRRRQAVAQPEVIDSHRRLRRPVTSRWTPAAPATQPPAQVAARWPRPSRDRRAGLGAGSRRRRGGGGLIRWTRRAREGSTWR